MLYGSPLYSMKVKICTIIWQALYDLACSLLLTLCILFSTTLPCCHYSREPRLLPRFLWSAIGTLITGPLLWLLPLPGILCPQPSTRLLSQLFKPHVNEAYLDHSFQHCNLTTAHIPAIYNF